MIRPLHFRCLLGFHNGNDVDNAGREFCDRCGKRAAKRFATIRDPETAGRELNRPKTRRQRGWK